jgi:hypothetical protein
MSIYSYSRDGVALANYLVASAFDATSAHIFAAAAASGSVGVPVHAIGERVPRAHKAVVPVDVAIATLWKHGLIEYRVLAPLRAGASSTTKKEESANSATTNLNNNNNNNNNNDDDDDVLPVGARHVVVACVDVALWRARQATHCELLAQFLIADDSAVRVLRRLFRQGTLSYAQLTRNLLEADERDEFADVDGAAGDDARLDRERAVALLYGLGFVVERVPLDAEADRRHTVQSFLNSRAPKSRIDVDGDKSAGGGGGASSSSKAGTKRGKAGAGAVAAAPPPRKRPFASAAAATTAVTSGAAASSGGGRSKAPPPPEPAVVASGAMADDTDEPNYLGVDEKELPEAFKHNLKICRNLRNPRRCLTQDQIITESHNFLLREQEFRHTGRVWNFNLLDADDRKRACELNLCISPIAVALLQRLELMFAYMKERFAKEAGLDALLDTAYTGVATMSVPLFADELRFASLASREAPCVMRRTMVLAPLPMAQLIKELRRSAREITAQLQPLIAAELVELDAQSNVLFNTKRLQTALFYETLDAHVGRTISSDARRVIALLREKPHLTDGEIQHACLLSQKSARIAIGRLMSADLVRFAEFPKQADYAPARSIYLWSLAHGEQLRAAIRDRIHASLLRLARRLDAEHERLSLESVLAAGLDVRGTGDAQRFVFDEAAERELARGGDDDAEPDLEILEERRRLFECGKWLERVHRKVFTVNMQLFEKLERLEANVNF